MWSRMFWYFLILYCFDFSRLVRGIFIVSSRILIFCLSTTTRSRRHVDWKILSTEFHFSEGMSTYNNWSADFTAESHSASSWRMLLWRSVYLSRQTEAEQLASTCLLDWILLHRQHSGLSIFFQRWRLDAVGSCWISAYLAKLKMWLGIDSRTAAQMLIFCRDMLSLMTLTAWPWTLRERTWVMAFSSCVLCRLNSAFVAVCSFTNWLSVTVMLLGSWRPSAWAFISMRMIHSSTAAARPQMRKHYRDWSSVPSRQFVCGWRQTGFD